MKTTGFLWASLSATIVNGYILQFHDSATSRCGGQSLPDVTAIVGDCGNYYRGLAQQVLIKPEDDESGLVVKFFSDEHCTEDKIIAEGQAGHDQPVCLGLAIGGSQYGSFKIVKAPKEWTRSEERIQKEKRAELVQRTADASEVPNHGDVFVQGNQTWRWHQISKSGWKGVLIHDWDDELHTPNHKELPESDDDDNENDHHTTAALEPKGSSLDQRDFKGMCRSTVLCTANLLERSVKKAYSLKERGPDIVNEIAKHAKDARKPIWDFLNTPFVTAMSGVAGTAGVIFANTYINNKWAPGKPKPTVEACSTLNSQADVMKSAIKEATQLSDLEAVEIVIDFENGGLSRVHTSLSKHKGEGKCGRYKEEPKDL